jgi:hypothetical protein
MHSRYSLTIISDEMDKVIKKKDLLLSLGFFVEKVYFYNQCYEKKLQMFGFFQLKSLGRAN